MVEAIPIRRVNTNVGDLLRTTLEPLTRQARGLDVGMNVRIAGDLPDHLLVDAEKMAWVVATLVGSALRYVHHGTRAMPGGSVSVQASYAPATSTLTIDVTDDGPGIPADVLGRLVRSEAGRPRTGLALSMASDVAAAHGGRLDLHSSTDSVDHGTTIKFTVPAPVTGVPAV